MSLGQIAFIAAAAAAGAYAGYKVEAKGLGR